MGSRRNAASVRHSGFIVQERGDLFSLITCLILHQLVEVNFVAVLVSIRWIDAFASGGLKTQALPARLQT